MCTAAALMPTHRVFCSQFTQGTDAQVIQPRGTELNRCRPTRVFAVRVDNLKRGFVHIACTRWLGLCGWGEVNR